MIGKSWLNGCCCLINRISLVWQEVVDELKINEGQRSKAATINNAELNASGL